MRIKFALAGLILVHLFQGCGGDSSDSGNFVDSPVSGLSYESPSTMGETDGTGRFFYNSGEAVTFFLGDTVLGNAIGAIQVSPFDLVPGVGTITAARDVRKFYLGLFRENTVSMEIVTNIALFLQNLDDDGFLDNGIQIPESVGDLLTGISIDFNKKIFASDDIVAFQKQASFQSLRNNGFNQGLWNGGRPIMGPGYVLDHLYETLGLVPEIYRQSQFSIDQDMDGIPELIFELSYDETGRLSHYKIQGPTTGKQTFIYNELNQIIRLEGDLMDDGTVDEVTTLEYDNRGNFIKSIRDDNNNGTPDEIETVEYNELNQITLKSVDNNGDGTPDDITTYAYDAAGNEIREEQDQGADGSIDTLLLKSYDERGNKILEEKDTGGNGSIESRTAWTYDENNLEILEEEDNDGNGSVDQIIQTTYDENLFRIRRELDIGLDGTIEGLTTYQNDELGNVTREDNYSNGVLTGFTVNQTDENGNTILSESDFDGDGIIDETVFVEYELTDTWVSLFSGIDTSL